VIPFIQFARQDINKQRPVPPTIYRSVEYKPIRDEMARLVKAAEKKGSGYGLKSHLRDVIHIYEFAKAHQIRLDVFYFDARRALGIEDLFFKAEKNDRTNKQFDRGELREEWRILNRIEGELGHSVGGPGIAWWNNLFWGLLAIYFKLMLFSFLFYLVRLSLCQGGHSLKGELLMAPGRFVRAVVFWPQWLMTYGCDTDPAVFLRYLRLKAELLRSKPLLYQLTPVEEAFLHREAEQPIKNFDQILVALRGQEIVVRRSLAVAVLSLTLGFLVAHCAPRRAASGAAVGQIKAAITMVIKDFTDRIVPKILPTDQAPSAGLAEVADWFFDLLRDRPLRERPLPAPLFLPPPIPWGIDHVPRRFSSGRIITIRMGV